MGSYLNPGATSFRNSLRSEIYIDKSGLIEKTNGCIQSRDISASAGQGALENLWLQICWLHIMEEKKTQKSCLII